MPFEVIEHTADTGIRVWAHDLPSLFSEAAMGMLSQITELARVEPVQERTITIDGMDETDLLINTLRELLYMFNGEELLAVALEVELSNGSVAKERISYEKYDPRKHKLHMDIKAVTYAGGDIRKIPGGFEITVIFDI